MKDAPLALTFADVSLVPLRSGVASRSDVDTSSRFSRSIELAIPIVSANMDTVTMAPMAIELARLGGLGVLHRFLSVEEEAAEVRTVKRAWNLVVDDPYAVSPDLEAGAARALADGNGVSGLLVVADERLVGIVTGRDFEAAAPGMRVAEVMTPRERLVVAPRDVAVEDARRLMLDARVEKLPLVDGERAAGLITLRDIRQREAFPQATLDGSGRLRVAAAIGVRGSYLHRAEALVEAEVDALVLDIAHGHAEHALRVVREVKDAWPHVDVVAGNVATVEGYRDLVEAGADGVKAGVGPGFACTTRIVAGTGVPQWSVVAECADAARELGVPLNSDGGIREPGDVAKAIGAGADSVMIGSLFAGRPESPGRVVRRDGRRYKVYRGMASTAAAASRLAIEGRGDALDQYVAEGAEMQFELKGPVAESLRELVGGLRSAMAYADALTIADFQRKARFVRQTDAGRRESHPGRGD
jgi:IMP dehydrogenase